MIDRSYAHSFAAAILCVTALSHLGCAPQSGADDSPAVETEDQPNQMLTGYIDALQRMDTVAVDRLISTELRDRITTRGPATDFESNLQAFVSGQRDKLMRSVPASDALDKPLVVEAAGTPVDDSTMAVELTINGQQLPRPLYLVKEAAGFKLNVVKPDLGRSGASILEGNTYLVKNDDGVARSFSCSGQSASTVAANQSLQKFCNDSCSGFFDGTRFTVNGASADCDFNTFGTDMFIRNNSPVCNDPC